jgi:beta-galactosamide-alpha-2,3-sialyltransferase
MTSALVLCRSPFQAYLAARVLEREHVDRFDLLYHTHHDSEEDRNYFAKLSRRAEWAEYAHVPIRRFDITLHLLFRARARRFLRDLGHDVVMLGSIDNLVFSAIAKKQSKARLVTFDDGMSNVFKDGVYRKPRFKGRGEFYRALFGAYNLREARDKIERHYTIYPQFENIVPTDRLVPIENRTWNAEQRSEGPVFFIGQPFEMVLDHEQIERLTAYLRTQAIDLYVRHPYESDVLNIGAPELDKGGLIAEEAVLMASAGKKPTIIGWQSNVMFNIAPEQANKVLVVLTDATNRAEVTRLGRATGCEVVVI